MSTMTQDMTEQDFDGSAPAFPESLERFITALPHCHDDIVAVMEGIALSGRAKIESLLHEAMTADLCGLAEEMVWPIRESVCSRLRLLPEDFPFAVVEDRVNLRLTLNMSRNLKKWPLTEEEEPDAVRRADFNCQSAGEVGHFGCGVCIQHMKLHRECGCYHGKARS